MPLSSVSCVAWRVGHACSSLSAWRRACLPARIKTKTKQQAWQWQWQGGTEWFSLVRISSLYLPPSTSLPPSLPHPLDSVALSPPPLFSPLYDLVPFTFYTYSPFAHTCLLPSTTLSPHHLALFPYSPFAFCLCTCLAHTTHTTPSYYLPALPAYLPPTLPVSSPPTTNPPPYHYLLLPAIPLPLPSYQPLPHYYFPPFPDIIGGIGQTLTWHFGT